MFHNGKSEYTKDMSFRLSENDNLTRVERNHDVDHVHILFKAHSNTDMTKFMKAYKSASSQLMKRVFPQMKNNLWNERVRSAILERIC